ncbi:asparagine synthetase B, partial [bacterium]|nr:asparagine synthetase B [bacterium]
MIKKVWLAWNCVLFFGVLPVKSQHLLVPMDLSQSDHLKAYGIAYWTLEQGITVEWLLNYRAGSFLMRYEESLVRQCRIRGVGFEIVDGAAFTAIYSTIEENNMEVIVLEKAPSIAVYTPPNKQPWDDAVTLVLTYAEIPYQTIWDEEVLRGQLDQFDWLHLHHEDFTGQYGKFYGGYRNADWYIEQQQLFESEAKRLGFKKVSLLKLAVTKKIKDYVLRGGFLFAMCSATDSYDIALAAEGTDICDAVFDGDPVDPSYQDQLDYTRCFAFENFTLFIHPTVYEFSDIDTTPMNQTAGDSQQDDYFTLFEFSAKYDPVPTMLTQNHVSVIREFMGQTTGYHKKLIKKSVIVMAEKAGTDEVKYIHGN